MRQSHSEYRIHKMSTSGGAKEDARPKVLEVNMVSMDRETEAQRGQNVCFQSHSKLPLHILITLYLPQCLNHQLGTQVARASQNMHRVRSPET